MTISAQVSGSGTIQFVREAFQLNGLASAQDAADAPLSDDGTGTGTFTNKNVSTASTTTGPRDVRIVAETLSGGLLHATAVEVDGLSVVTQAPTPALQFSAASYSAPEDAGTATVTVTRTGDSSGTVTVHYATSDGSAHAGTDYTAESADLTFAAGVTTQTFTVPVIHDGLPGSDKTVNLTLSGPSGASLGSQSTAVLTIVEVDNPGGSLDPSFGNGGVVLTGFPGSSGDEPGAVAVQPDGKVVVVGSSNQVSTGFPEFALARFTPAGALDPTFGTGGLVLTTFPNSVGAAATGVTVLSDGSILVAGSTTPRDGRPEFVLVRYTPTGVLDTTFGTGGFVIFVFPGTATGDTAAGLGVEPDGSIVLVGTSNQASGPEIALVRFTPAGVLDTGFGTGGVVLTALPNSGGDTGAGLAVQPDGSIVVVGSSLQSGVSKVAVVRLTPAGAPDPTFGGTGLVLTVIVGSSGDTAAGVAIQDDGGIVVAGTSSQTGGGQFAVLRYSRVGALDNTFGNGGVALTKFAGSTGDSATGVAVQRDGRITVTGKSGGQFGVAQYTKTGAPDSGFGSGGTVRTQLPNSSGDSPAGVAVKPGKVVVAGTSSQPGGKQFAVTQYTAGVASQGAVQFGGPTFSAREADGTATITVTRTGGTSASATVHYATSDGSAVAGRDYTAASGTPTFAPGQTSQTFTVTLLPTTAVVTGTATVNLTLSSPSGTSLGSQATAVLNLTGSSGTPPPPVHHSASLITKKVGKKRKLFVEVTSSAGGAPVDLLSPFQKPAFKGITVTVNAADQVVLTAKKGRKTVTQTLAV